jgi:uncharacterized protein (DUF2249 family)
MSDPTDATPAADNASELDVRAIPKPQRHPLIFARFDALPVGESFVLVNSHDPRHLHDEFERDHPGAFAWTYLATGDPRLFRVEITRRQASAPSGPVTSPVTEAAGRPVWEIEPADEPAGRA